MTSGEKEGLTPSASSSTERKKCGYSEHGFRPFQGHKDEPGKPHCLTCGHHWNECNWHWVEGDPLPGKPECQHPAKRFTGSLYDGPAGRKSYVYYSCPDCKARWKEEERKTKPECNCDPMREVDGYTLKSAYLHAAGCPLGQQPEDPPLTPEEEEEAPQDRCTCGETACESELCDCDSAPCPVDHASEAPEDEEVCAVCGEGPVVYHNYKDDPFCRNCADPPLPQPERRPPLLVLYSVQGHLYEVALPGDASVRAVDGALVIQHGLGPVAGIVQVLPVINKESA